MRRSSAHAPARQGLAARAVLGLSVLSGLLLGCRGSASEAPEPDANAWSQSDAEPVSNDDDFDDAAPTATDRARPDGAIYRDEIERVTSRGPAYLLRQLGPEPFRHDGRFVGWTVTRLFPDDPSLCAPTCDLAIGDVIIQVNGNRLETPQHLSNALQELPGWDTLDIVSLRDGVRRRRVYPIVDSAGEEPAALAPAS